MSARSGARDATPSRGLKVNHTTPSLFCDICNKTFGRSEHLERHRRIHTNERPFPCPRCEQSFPRSDVRALHVKKTHGIDFAAINVADQDMNGPKRKRVKTACDLCRKRKLRCDGDVPCRHCRNGEVSCQHHSTATITLSATSEQNRSRSRVGENMTIVEVEDQGQLNEQMFTPVATSAGSVPLTSPPSQEGQVQDTYLESFSTCENHGTNELTSMMTDPVTGLVAGNALQADHANGIWPDFWQMPLLSGEAWWDDIDLHDDFQFDNSVLLYPEGALDSSHTKAYFQLMQEYFDRRSRATSPAPNKAASMWYSAPTSLWDQDLEVVNVFLNIFSRNVPKVFRLFQNLNITDETRPEYILAAAAVGGLYCTTAGNFDFSKVMYNDSRRLLFSSTKSPGRYSKMQPSYETVMSIIKTYILNELYGFCSGDKRSYEFVEVFHQDLAKALQSLGTLYGTNPPPSRADDIICLQESLHILDCYRVCILQRPPSLLWSYLDNLPKSSSTNESSSSIHDLVISFINPGFAVDSKVLAEFSLASLSGLSPFLWLGLRLAAADEAYMEILSKPDFVELAADKWLRSHDNSPEPAALILYHLMNMAMHANLLVVQNHAHWSSSSETSDKDRDRHRSCIERWVRGKHYKIAKWHAKRTLECVSQANSVYQKDNMISARRLGRQPAKLSGEAPGSAIDVAHVPYSIYYATLILWCGEGDVKHAFARSSYLARGKNLLSRQKLRIATLLEHALSRVET